eukprot:CAMPEP_0113275340 /NCGR_PEP_ID=MMETSP0008_2-20120614/24894_1 /TAXON_ID=97485 /ORGANISM="Prymnesium parvum" /LENGTH=89 /DNA_ID=CAMNT_0000125041 /DNA_START=130 /DNA_END=397 /DNA_ORIENTATION=+ /assembly_acc=CAM_ASM_000153
MTACHGKPSLKHNSSLLQLTHEAQAASEQTARDASRSARMGGGEDRRIDGTAARHHVSKGQLVMYGRAVCAAASKRVEHSAVHALHLEP